jgi:2-polyprenyl-6-methoxyphenol hydroxylase-like FAD-dependent oxidoreductase
MPVNPIALRHGVKPRVVERRLAPHGETRGTALQPAELEILDRAGLIATVRIWVAALPCPARCWARWR